MSFWSGIQRMVTLPKAKNSLDDILGPQVATLARAVLRELIEQGIASALSGVKYIDSSVILKVSPIINKTLMGKVPADLISVIDDAANRALTLSDTTLKNVGDRINNEIVHALKL